MIDFEQSMVGTLDRVYLAVPQKGCLFPLSKNIYKRVQQEGLSQLSQERIPSQVLSHVIRFTQYRYLYFI